MCAVPFSKSGDVRSLLARFRYGDWTQMKVLRPKFYGTYGTARSVVAVLSVLGWIVVVIGGIAMVVGLSAPAPFNFLVVVAGVIIAAIGVLQVAAGQMLRATVDTADYGRQSLMLQIAAVEQASEVDLRSDDFQPPVASRAPESEIRRQRPQQPEPANTTKVRREKSTKQATGETLGTGEPWWTYQGRRWRRKGNGIEGELLNGEFKEFSSLEEFKRYID
jgi:hypothetical protein